MIALAIALPLLPFAERNVIDRATLILIYVLLATGLNIVVGLAGLLDLGYVAFYAVGAYSYALLTQDFGLTFWIGAAGRRTLRGRRSACCWGSRCCACAATISPS